MVSVKTNKKISKHDNMMNKGRRQPSTGQKKEKNILADSNYFYKEESKQWINFGAHVMQVYAI